MVWKPTNRARVLALLALMAVSCGKSPVVSSTPSNWGLTLDSVNGASANQLAPIVNAIKSLPQKPWVRLVIANDGNATDMDPNNYATAFSNISPGANVMWQICDSYYVSAASQAQISNVTSSFLAAYPSVNLWEVGNELNGEWLGGQPYTSATGQSNPPVAKAYAAWKLVTAAGKQSALTLYYEPSQTVTAGYDMVTWAQNNFASLPDMANGLNYVFVSYYETQNNNIRPSLSDWTSIFQSLHAAFPNARLGFGEVGLPAAATASTLAQAQAIMAYYYSLRPSVPGWFGGYFWWYAQEDFVAQPSLLNLFQSFMTN